MAADTKLCRHCASEMPAQADICLKCNSRQGWLQGLQIGSTTLSLIVAAISTAGLAIPAIKGALHEPSAKIDIISWDFEKDGRFSFAAVNSGDAPGLFAYPVIVLDYVGEGAAPSYGERLSKKQAIFIDLVDKDPPEGGLLPSGGTQRITYRTEQSSACGARNWLTEKLSKEKQWSFNWVEQSNIFEVNNKPFVVCKLRPLIPDWKNKFSYALIDIPCHQVYSALVNLPSCSALGTITVQP